MINQINDGGGYTGFIHTEPCDISFWLNKIRELDKVYVYECKVCNKDKFVILKDAKTKKLVECIKCKTRKIIYKKDLVRVEHL